MSDYEFGEYRLRAQMVAALRRYADEGEPLGGFLQAAVQNHFVQAVNRADDDNLKNLPALAAYIYNEIPDTCWGSTTGYYNWLEKKRVEKLVNQPQGE